MTGHSSSCPEITDPADLWDAYLAETDNPSPQGAMAFTAAWYETRLAGTHDRAQSEPDDQSLSNIADWLEQKGMGGSAKIVREAAVALRGVAQGAVDPELIALLGRLKAAASVMLFELKPGDSKNVHMHNLTDRERDLLACALPSTKLGSPK